MKLKILKRFENILKGKEHRCRDALSYAVLVSCRNNGAVAVYIICIDVTGIKVLGCDLVIRLLTVFYENLTVDHLVIARIVQRGKHCRLFTLDDSIAAGSRVFI